MVGNDLGRIGGTIHAIGYLQGIDEESLATSCISLLFPGGINIKFVPSQDRRDVLYTKLPQVILLPNLED